MGVRHMNFVKAGAIAATLGLSLVLAGCGDDDNGASAGLGDRDWGDFGREGDVVLGDPDAPVSVVEYASVTCGHCAAFHVQTFPHMEEEYIETGMVRYVMRALPTPPMTMARLGFMTATCVGDERYYAFIDALMRTQNAWAFNPDPESRLTNLGLLARQAGMTEDEFDACRVNQAALDLVNESAEDALEIGVNSTPTFFINGEQINGAMDWTNFEPNIIRFLPEELRPVPAEETDSEATGGDEG